MRNRNNGPCSALPGYQVSVSTHPFDPSSTLGFSVFPGKIEESGADIGMLGPKIVVGWVAFLTIGGGSAGWRGRVTRGPDRQSEPDRRAQDSSPSHLGLLLILNQVCQPRKKKPFLIRFFCLLLAKLPACVNVSSKLTM